MDLDLLLAHGTDAASIYAIRVPSDWDSEKVASHIVALLTTNANDSSSWANAFSGWLYNIKRDSAAYEKWLRTVKMEILRKAGQNAELYLKLAVGALPGGAGVLALDSLSKGNYAEAALEVFFLVPWLRMAGGGLNHIKIVARNGDEVIVARRAVEAWQDAVYNGGKAGLKRAEDLGQALKAGGRNADEVIDALRRGRLEPWSPMNPGALRQNADIPMDLRSAGLVFESARIRRLETFLRERYGARLIFDPAVPYGRIDEVTGTIRLNPGTATFDVLAHELSHVRFSQAMGKWRNGRRLTNFELNLMEAIGYWGTYRKGIASGLSHSDAIANASLGPYFAQSAIQALRAGSQDAGLSLQRAVNFFGRDYVEQALRFAGLGIDPRKGIPGF